jgi:uncharacterized protein
MIDVADMDQTIWAKTIVEFCRFTRQRGLSNGVPETLGAFEAAALLGVTPSEELKSGLRAVLCSSRGDWDLFEECFREFWERSNEERASVRPIPGNEKRSGQEAAFNPGRKNTISLMSTGSNASNSSEGDGARAVAGASARQRLAQADLSTLAEDDMSVLEQIALRLVRQMSRRLARRRRIGVREQVDLRKTIRRNISRGGDPISLRFRQRKPRPHRLVTLLDISGSMSAYSIFLVKFLYALQRYCPHVDTFLFSTNLVEITSLFRTPRFSDALRALSEQPAGWSGGTKIGGSLREFNQVHSKKLRSADTLFVILSDGWDTGDGAELAAELAVVKRRVRKLIWLNPLLGLKEYQPITSGMSAALPHIDVFAPAHSLESLLALERHL